MIILSKTIIKAIGLVLVLIICLGVAEKNDFLGMKKWGKEKCYVQIKEDGIEKVLKSEDGMEFTRYYYKMNAYNKDGDKISVQFHSSKNLKMNAFLVVYVLSGSKQEFKEILTYEEITEKELPLKVKGKLNQ